MTELGLTGGGGIAVSPGRGAGVGASRIRGFVGRTLLAGFVVVVAVVLVLGGREVGIGGGGATGSDIPVVALSIEVSAGAIAVSVASVSGIGLHAVARNAVRQRAMSVRMTGSAQIPPGVSTSRSRPLHPHRNGAKFCAALIRAEPRWPFPSKGPRRGKGGRTPGLV